VGVLGAHLSERFRLVRDIVVFLISVYALYNIINFYTKGYLDGIKAGIKMNAPVAENVLKETICYQTPNCTLYCNEIKYETVFNNLSFPFGYQHIIKEVNSFCLKDLGNKKFLLIGE
jgi:hypothetical protein